MAPRQIEMERSDNIDPGFRPEEIKLGAYSRVEIQQLVATVTPVEPPIEIGDALIAELPAEVRRQLGEGLVRDGTTMDRHPSMRWPGTELYASERRQADRVRVAIAVEDPVLGRVARKVFLEHEARRFGPFMGEQHELFWCIDDGAARDRGCPKSLPRFDVLEDDGKDPALGVGENFVLRRRNDGIRRRDTDFLAELVEPSLAREGPRQPGGDSWGHEIARVRMLRKQYGSLVVGGEDNGGAVEPSRDCAQPMDQLALLLEPGSSPHEMPSQVAAESGRLKVVLRDRIHGHPHPTQRSNRVYCAMVKRVVADLDEEYGNRAIEQDRTRAHQGVIEAQHDQRNQHPADVGDQQQPPRWQHTPERALSSCDRRHGTSRTSSARV